MLPDKIFEMKLRIIIWSLCIFTIPGICIYGQTDAPVLTHDQCSPGIMDAGRLFQQGLYDECTIKLESILATCKLSRSEKELAMELLAKAYVEVLNPGKAESVVKTMLNKFPHYELDENENFEAYNRLVKRFSIHPAFTIGARNTALWKKFSTTRTFTLPDGPANTEPYFYYGYMFSYYGWAELEFDKGISLNGDLMWWNSGLNRNISDPDLNIDLDYWEWQELIEIPLYIKKYFRVGKDFLPYITGGLGWLYMLNANGNLNNKDEDNPKIINNVDMMSMRNKNNFEWLAGAGIGYKLKNLRFFGDIRYYGGLNSFTNAEHRLDNQMLTEDFLYVDNSVKMNKFEIGVSISYTFINSVKRIK